MGRYDGKCAVITGGTSGIGLATAQLLVQEGARVLLTGRTKTSLESSRKLLGDQAAVYESDASSLQDIDQLANRSRELFGQIDLLFLNAGVTRWSPFETTSEAIYDEVLTVNAKGPYFTAQRFVPVLREGSAIVFTTSVVNEMGFPLVSVYAASKAALRSMARSLAKELLPKKIRVNAVSPGPTDTPVLEKALSKDAAEKAMAQMRETNPMKRLAEPEEVARAVVFLGFEATFTTGAEIPVDGGGSQL